jgi:hypothetical protein
MVLAMNRMDPAGWLGSAGSSRRFGGTTPTAARRLIARAKADGEGMSEVEMLID